MTKFTASGTHGSIPGAHQSSHMLASIGGPATLTRVTVTGFCSVEVANQTITAGAFAQSDLVGGIQYGPIGYTVVQNTTGSNVGATYLTYDEFFDYASGDIVVPGSSPQNTVESSFIAIDVKWRGLFPVPTGVDVYMVIGMDTSVSYDPTIEAYFSWYVEWASFP